MLHNETPSDALLTYGTYNNEDGKRKRSAFFYPGDAVEPKMIHWIYTLQLFAEDAETNVPCDLSKSRLFTIAFVKANITALCEVVV